MHTLWPVERIYKKTIKSTNPMDHRRTKVGNLFFFCWEQSWQFFFRFQSDLSIAQTVPVEFRSYRPCLWMYFTLYPLGSSMIWYSSCVNCGLTSSTSTSRTVSKLELLRGGSPSSTGWNLQHSRFGPASKHEPFVHFVTVAVTEIIHLKFPLWQSLVGFHLIRWVWTK